MIGKVWNFLRDTIFWFVFYINFSNIFLVDKMGYHLIILYILSLYTAGCFQVVLKMKLLDLVETN